MRVLILGANGLLGPHVVKALEGHHELRLTDVTEIQSSHEHAHANISSPDQVTAAAKGMDAIINCSVSRYDRRLAFDVNARGCYNVMAAAVRHGIRRVINTGPRFSIVGPTYLDYEFQIGPDIPPQPGTGLYALSKSLGQEVCRVFSENHDVHVIFLVVSNFWSSGDVSSVGQDLDPFSVTWDDAAEAFRHALEVDLSDLPSRCEPFFLFTDVPHGQFIGEKTKAVLGWQPRDQLEQFWRKPA